MSEIKILDSKELDTCLKNGQVALMKIESKRFCLGKYNDTYFALDDRCPHAGGSLSEGNLSAAGYVICPIHRLAYDLLTGKAAGGGYYVRKYELDNRPEGLFIIF